MKKSLFILPLAALILTACNSGSSSESSTETVEANNTSWQAADIQPAAMPSSMNQPISTPSYGGSIPQPASAGSYGATETVGNCQVVRDASGAPIYAQIQKGCYTESRYTVGKQDTLYLIGYLTGQNANKIASLNGLNPSAKLKVGQTLRVR